MGAGAPAPEGKGDREDLLFHHLFLDVRQPLPVPPGIYFGQPADRVKAFGDLLLVLAQLQAADRQQEEPEIMALNGYIKMYRKLIKWGWYKDYVVKDTFLHLLLTANFKDTSWNGIVIKRGQVVTGTEALADSLGFTRQQIRTALKKLKSTNEITTESTNKYTLITLVNWDEYQSDENYTTIDSTNYLTNEDKKSKIENEQFMNNCKQNMNLQTVYKISTNKITNRNIVEILKQQGFTDSQIKIVTNTLTNEQPTTNQQLTNNQPQRKNDKNEKKEKKGPPVPAKPPGVTMTDEEWAAHVAKLRE